MSIFAEKLLALLAAEVGTKELTGHNDGAVTKYTGGREEPWCSHLVAWAFRTIGCPLPGDRIPHMGKNGENPIAAVSKLREELELHGCKLDAPEPGCIMISIRPGGLHVGIVEIVGKNNLTSIEGNYKNAVLRRGWLLNDEKILDYYRWPKESAGSYGCSLPA